MGSARVHRTTFRWLRSRPGIPLKTPLLGRGLSPPWNCVSITSRWAHGITSGNSCPFCGWSGGRSLHEGLRSQPPPSHLPPPLRRPIRRKAKGRYLYFLPPFSFKDVPGKRIDRCPMILTLEHSRDHIVGRDRPAKDDLHPRSILGPPDAIKECGFRWTLAIFFNPSR